MYLPQDPNILLSVINTNLRDKYPSLDALCDDFNIEKSSITQKLSTIGYAYDSTANIFLPE